MHYDLAIIGGGPAGCAAAVYAARKRLRTALLAYDFGGQSTVSADIQNWIGTPSISGADLAKNLEDHVRTYAGDIVDIRSGEKAVSIRQDGMKEGTVFTVTTDQGEYTARAVLIATGSNRRRLAVPGADDFEHKGITYCASCDGPLFAGQDVAVIGGGNAGFETAAQLLAYAKSVTLLHYRDEYKADPVTVQKVLSHPSMTGILDADVTEIYGQQFAGGLKYRDKKTGETKDLPVSGIFVEIGQIPNTDFVKDIVERDQGCKIVVDPMTQRSSVPGIWAAGDCTNGLYHQNNIAAGDAVKALEDIYNYLHTQ